MSQPTNYTEFYDFYFFHHKHNEVKLIVHGLFHIPSIKNSILPVITYIETGKTKSDGLGFISKEYKITVSFDANNASKIPNHTEIKQHIYQMLPIINEQNVL